MQIIVIEGIDCAGKETQVRKLADALIYSGYRVEVGGLPRYWKPTGQWVKDVLTDKVKISKEALHLLIQVDAQDNMDTINELEANGVEFLIMDRYTLSNQAYCMAKGIDLDWVKAFQSKMKKPDLTFVLDISAETSFNRKTEGRDVHEIDVELLNRARAAYHFLAGKQADVAGDDELIYLIDANGTQEDIHDSIMSYVHHALLTGGES